MKELTPEQIQDNWNKLMKLIDDTFEGDRLKNLKEIISLKTSK